MDAIVAGILLAIGMIAVLGVSGHALTMQRRGEIDIRAAAALDEIALVGADRGASRFRGLAPTRGKFDAGSPDEDFSTKSISPRAARVCLRTLSLARPRPQGAPSRLRPESLRSEARNPILCENPTNHSTELLVGKNVAPARRSHRRCAVIHQTLDMPPAGSPLWNSSLRSRSARSSCGDDQHRALAHRPCARTVTRTRLDAVTRATAAMDSLRRDLSSIVRSADLFDTRLVSSTDRTTQTTGRWIAMKC
jgi:hypothetical protein